MSFGIWNSLDETALYLGLERFKSETNDELAHRIKQFAKYRYKTDYYTQVHSIPLQCGLNTDPFAIIRNKNGNNFICEIGWDIFTLKEILPDGSQGEYIRIFLEGKNVLINKVSATIASGNSFELNFIDEYKINLPVSYLVRNKNVKNYKEKITDRYFQLENTNIVAGSFLVDHDSFKYSVDGITGLKKEGDYFIDYKTGVIQTYDIIQSEIDIAYQYYEKVFFLESTELSLTPMNRVFAYGITDDNYQYIPYLVDQLVAG
jgi:hypothetical protein